MYIERFVEHDILKWKDTCRTSVHKYALEVTGSRQVGKTTTVLHFAENNYENVVYVDVRKSKQVEELVLVDFTNVKCVVEEYCKERDIEYTDDQNTVIIFDEIQESKDLYECIRTYNRGLKCDLIVTGSNLQKTIGLFQPAGDLQELRMYPLSYEEYLEYFGAYDYYKRKSINEICTEKYDWFRKAYDVYKVVGGYPSVFIAYLEERSISDAFEAILRAFKSEFRVVTGEPSDYDKIEVMFNTICEVLIKEKKGEARMLDFVSKITEQNKNKRISAKECNHILAWLSASRIINFCDKIDLRTGEAYPSERFYFDDVGLLNYLCTRLQFERTAVEGILAENFIFKQLKDGNFEERFYRTRPSFGINKDYEIDFIVSSVTDGCKYGIEVKNSDNAGVSANSMLTDKQIDFLVYAKGSSKSEARDGNKFTVPLFLFNKFVFDKGGRIEKEMLPKIEAFK